MFIVTPVRPKKIIDDLDHDMSAFPWVACMCMTCHPGREYNDRFIFIATPIRSPYFRREL